MAIATSEPVEPMLSKIIGRHRITLNFRDDVVRRGLFSVDLQKTFPTEPVAYSHAALSLSRAKCLIGLVGAPGLEPGTR